MSKFLETLDNIVSTATISYYVGRGVKCRFHRAGDEARNSTSFYNPLHDEIVISSDNIVYGIMSLCGKDADEYWTFTQEMEDDNNFENMVKQVGGIQVIENLGRAILYHETSHVMHTPKCLFNYGKMGYNSAVHKYFEKHKKDIVGKSFDKRNPNNIVNDESDFDQALRWYANINPNNIVNIFEDQRIEEINKNYYLHVDFRKNLELMNPGYQKSFKNMVKDIDQLFFEVCRFQHARNALCQKWIDKINELIFAHMDINCASELDIVNGNVVDDYNTYKGQNILTPEGEEVHQMFVDVFTIVIQMVMKYDLFRDGQKKHPIPTIDGGEGIESDFEGEGEGKGQPKPSKEELSEEEKQKLREQAREKGQGGINKQHQEYDIKTVKDTSEMYPLVDTLKRKLIQKFITSCITQKGIMGYSGRFKPRYFIRPHMNEGKLFYKENPEGGVSGKGSKKRLNIWLDWSGSYKHNCEKTNKIIAIVSQIEKENKNFEFNLIAMGGADEYETKLLDKNRRCSGCNGGTDLNGKEVKRIYHQLSKDPTIKSVNIVLFDGIVENGFDSLKVFDNKNSFFIVDRGVAHQLENGSRRSWESDGNNPLCPNAHIQTVSDGAYPEQLLKNVQKAIETLL